MLHLTCELLESKSRIAQQVHTVYKYVCIDEFQDTNLAQYKLLRLLCPDSSSNLFVVADDDQIIFQWNGASPKRLEDLKNDYAPQIVQLPENYRCPASVVKIANLLIANNPRRVSMKKDSVSRRSTEGAVRFKRFRSFEEEVDGLISEIQSISKNLRETCLVIARSNKLLAQAKEKMNAKCMKAVRVQYI